MRVTLPRSQEPVFPDECLLCHAPSPGRTVTRWTLTLPWWAFLTGIAVFWSKIRKTAIPACGPCGWRMRFGRLGLVGVIVAIGCFMVWALDRWFPKNSQPFVAIPIALGFGLLIASWSFVRPPAIQIDVGEDVVSYKFRDWSYGTTFAVRNNGHIKTDE